MASILVRAVLQHIIMASLASLDQQRHGGENGVQCCGIKRTHTEKQHNLTKVKLSKIK